MLLDRVAKTALLVPFKLVFLEWSGSESDGENMHPRVIKQKLQYALKHHLLPLLLQKFAQGGMLNQICSLTISGIEAFSESNIHVFVIGRCCTANDLKYDMHVMHVMVFCQHKTILF